MLGISKESSIIIIVRIYVKNNHYAASTDDHLGLPHVILASQLDILYFISCNALTAVATSYYNSTLVNIIHIIR